MSRYKKKNANSNWKKRSYKTPKPFKMTAHSGMLKRIRIVII